MPQRERRPSRAPGAPPPRHLMLLAVTGAALLVVAGATAFWVETEINRGAGQGGNGQGGAGFRVAVSAEACTPSEITVPGGRRTFEIVNTSDRPIEWEILDGVMVVAERENIAPGFRQTLTAQLAPGDYAITCGLLSNPRGVLHVTESDEARAAAGSVSLRSFLGPLSEYKVYLIQQAAAASGATEELTAAIEAGDLQQARESWRAARIPYERIAPVAYRLSDLENAIDPVADYLAKREDDSAFTGFHRIEYGLFARGSTEGLAPVAARLAADTKTLRERLGGLRLDPALLLSVPGDMAGRLAQGKILQGQDHYAGSDLADFAANFEGIAKVAGLLQAVVRPVDPGLEARIDERLEAVRSALAGLKGEDGYPPYDSVEPAERKTLARKFQELADALGRLNAVIGVS